MTAASEAAQPGPSPLARGDELPVSEALACIMAALDPITEHETLGLASALGRVLHEDLVSPINVPAHDNSAMDGYALHGADLQGHDDTLLQAEAATAFAGEPYKATVARGRCIRIMTGAVMPPGLDTVVPIELCQERDGVVRIEPGRLKAGENRRRAGEDLAQGRTAMQVGRVLRPADLGLAASLGFESLVVRRRLRVALFSTGNELRTPGQPLDPGCIYDSNRFSLRGALHRLGCEVHDLGVVPDNEPALAAAMTTALAQCDAVVTSGGVSMGDADYTRPLLQGMGTVGFWKVAMRPGRPFAFGMLNGPEGRRTALFALPGNPVAALVTFYALAQPALRVLAGARAQATPLLRARSLSAIRKRPGRTEYQRAQVSQAPDGSWVVSLTGAQGAGILSSMSHANALVVLDHNQGSVAAGDGVDVLLFDGLV
jgi:molybdopterin molybdotransferase